MLSINDSDVTGDCLTAGTLLWRHKHDLGQVPPHSTLGNVFMTSYSLHLSCLRLLACSRPYTGLRTKRTMSKIVKMNRVHGLDVNFVKLYWGFSGPLRFWGLIIVPIDNQLRSSHTDKDSIWDPKSQRNLHQCEITEDCLTLWKIQQRLKIIP